MLSTCVHVEKACVHTPELPAPSSTKYKYPDLSFRLISVIGIGESARLSYLFFFFFLVVARKCSIIINDRLISIVFFEIIYFFIPFARINKENSRNIHSSYSYCGEGEKHFGLRLEFRNETIADDGIISTCVQRCSAMSFPKATIVAGKCSRTGYCLPNVGHDRDFEDIEDSDQEVVE